MADDDFDLVALEREAERARSLGFDLEAQAIELLASDDPDACAVRQWLSASEQARNRQLPLAMRIVALARELARFRPVTDWETSDRDARRPYLRKLRGLENALKTAIAPEPSDWPDCEYEQPPLDYVMEVAQRLPDEGERAMALMLLGRAYQLIAQAELDGALTLRAYLGHVSASGNDLAGVPRRVTAGSRATTPNARARRKQLDDYFAHEYLDMATASVLDSATAIGESLTT